MQLNTELLCNILLILFCFYDTANDYKIICIRRHLKRDIYNYYFPARKMITLSLIRIVL